MTSTERCLSPRELERLLLDDRLETIEDHLQSCRRCQDILDGVPVEQSLTAGLRTGLVEDPASLPSVQEMMERIEEMAVPASTRFSSEGQDADVQQETDFLLAPEAPDELGRLGHYRILSLLGRGGMGAVFRAEDTRLKRRVALKVMRSKIARRLDARERFLREARSMAAVKHDNIATIFEVDEAASADNTASIPYLAMELLEGQSLARSLRHSSKPPAVDWIIQIGRQIAAGLAHAHARGLIHRDIKPGNIWLEIREREKGRVGDGEKEQGSLFAPSPTRPVSPSLCRVKILDFGLAAPVDETATEIIGTPEYMAPEQLLGKPLDARCDLFALGCVLYEMCTGHGPFRRDVQTLRRPFTEDDPPVPLDRLNTAVPKPLARLIAQLLAPVPASRPASADEVEQELARLESQVALAKASKWRTYRSRATAAIAAACLVGLFALWQTGILSWKPEPEYLRKLASSIPPSLPHDEWRNRVQELPAEQQVRAVESRLKELNPGFSGQAKDMTIEKARVTGFWIDTSEVTDISPINALVDLRVLSCQGGLMSSAVQDLLSQPSALRPPASGKLKSLAPLAGLQIEELACPNNPDLSDFSGLKGMPLKFLHASETKLDNLDVLTDMPLEVLAILNTQVRDLSPVRTLRELKQLDCKGCPIESLEPLASTRIEFLQVDYRPERGDAEVLRGIKSLKTINLTSAKVFWEGR